MSNKSISGKMFKKMITNGAINLKNNHKEIDNLNVFPVPDGDTGTNMQMTMMAGVKEVKKNETESIRDVSKILSRGLLMGARGNSGVILSQFFRGLYSEISKIDSNSVSVDDFIQSLVGGYQMAYKAVMNPVEGTILTVVRESAEKVVQERKKLKTVEDVLKVYLNQAKKTLDNTPELLAVLKEAGVVDSGGAGFIKIIEGWNMALNGTELTESSLNNVIKAQIPNLNSSNVGAHALGDINIEFGYCTEFIVKLFNYHKFDEEQIKKPLLKMGDSLVVVTDDELLKVHVHTNEPGVALTLAQKYGEIQTVKIENMRIQHTTIMNEPVENHKILKEKSKYAIIAVASGEGLKNMFLELGVDHVIEGGQTMNPSAEDFVAAVNSVNAENIILLPNNSNIILTAEQTVDLCSDKNIRVLRTKNIAQGYSAMISFDPTIEIDENLEEMSDAVSKMKSGEITYSIRNTKIGDLNIKKGDFIGISNGKIEVCEKSRENAVLELINNLIDEETEILTIFYGNDVNQEELDKISEHIKSVNSEIEVEFVNGKQEIYSYIIASE